MFPQLEAILAKVEADYADLRYEIKQETIITFNGRELTQVGTNATDGFVLRVLKRGGFSSVTFTREDQAAWAVRTALENAGLLASQVSQPVSLAPVPAREEIFLPLLPEDPRRVPLEEKLELTRRYNEIPYRSSGIATTQTQYAEICREKYFINSEGSRLREDLVTTRLGGTITSRDGTLTQTVRVGGGGSDGFARLRHQDGEFAEKTKIALDLLKAEPVEAGAYNVVLNPDLTGVFTHEAFGHFSEADLIEDAPTMRERLALGALLGNEQVSITDDPTPPGQLGFYRYDDEGVAVRPTALLRQGVLVGRLHSRRTAAAFGEPVSGHCVAEDYRYPPIIRMGTIYLEPGEKSLAELLQDLGDGLYLLNALGGQTSGENFTFGAEYGYQVRGGRQHKMVRDINISGNLYQTLQRITGVGNDLTLSRTGGCGKGQLNVRSCHGGPHVLMEQMVIGGR
ncbi:MAG: TldD/PmbA family protein [Desulfobacterota bacterium]|jgi:TldD protein|nr:TldD/PmbA family protein [Thermodesulfobacteriota bacterium]